MATTTNFGWTTPDDTALVKDGASAIRTLGSSIDTSMAGLKGGTTGQVLSKTSNTDMAFTWVAQDDSNAIQNALVDAKGDLICATANDTPARLAVGTNGQYLSANSATSTGLEWVTPTSGGMTLISTTTLTGSSVTLSSIPDTYNELQLWVINFDPSAAARFRIAPNGGTTATDNVVLEAAGGGSATTQAFQGYMRTYNTFNATTATNTIIAVFPAYTSTAGRKSAYMTAGFLDGGGGNRTEAIFNKLESGKITSLVLSPDTGTFDGGTAFLYGVK